MTEDEQKFYDACAIAAMNAVLSAEVPEQISGDESDQQKAAWACFSLADAMLAERRKRMEVSND